MQFYCLLKKRKYNKNWVLKRRRKWTHTCCWNRSWATKNLCVRVQKRSVHMLVKLTVDAINAQFERMWSFGLSRRFLFSVLLTHKVEIVSKQDRFQVPFFTLAFGFCKCLNNMPMKCSWLCMHICTLVW